MVSWRKPREPASGFSYRELPPDAHEAAVEACRLYKVGIKDLIDDPVPSNLEQDARHQEARRWFVKKLSSPLIIRGKLARQYMYNSKEIGLMLDRTSREISYIQSGHHEESGESREELSGKEGVEFD